MTKDERRSVKVEGKAFLRLSPSTFFLQTSTFSP
jgi:hypothetical protein